MTTTNDWGYNLGTSYLLHLPPGWELVGTLVAIHRDASGDPATLEFDDCAYVESVSQSVHRIAAAQTPREMVNAVSTHHPVPDSLLVAAHLVTHATPCVLPSRILARGEEADAIRGAG